jgi:hypothetical protein
MGMLNAAQVQAASGRLAAYFVPIDERLGPAVAVIRLAGLLKNSTEGWTRCIISRRADMLKPDKWVAGERN